MHRIRLHGPWIVATRSRKDADQSPNLSENVKKILIPDQWRDWQRNSKDPFVELKRDFGFPTGLEPAQEIWLVIESENLLATIWLNNHLVGPLKKNETQLRRSVREHLLSRNCLQMHVTIPVHQGGDSGEENSPGLIHGVQLEIVG